MPRIFLFADSPVSADLQGREGEMARVTGLEPATSGVTGRHSNQLSYTRAFPHRAQQAASRAGRLGAGVPRVKQDEAIKVGA
jgi:hypothetical protein